MPAFPIIDSHLHIWDLKRLDYPWLTEVPALNRNFSLADYGQACGHVQVEAMVFLQCEADPSQYAAEATWVTEQAAADPRIQAIVPWAPLELGDAARSHLEKLAAFPLVRGVRRITKFDADPEYCTRPGLAAGVAALADFDFSFDLCVSQDQLAGAALLADRCPGVPMVLDHIGTPEIRDGKLEGWRTDLQTLAERPNVFCKLSGLATEADYRDWHRDQIRPYIDVALDAFGPNRLMFGGDWPVASQAIRYTGWVELLDWALDNLAEAEQRAIYRETAARFYRL